MARVAAPLVSDENVAINRSIDRTVCSPDAGGRLDGSAAATAADRARRLARAWGHYCRAVRCVVQECCSSGHHLRTRTDVTSPRTTAVCGRRSLRFQAGPGVALLGGHELHEFAGPCTLRLHGPARPRAVDGAGRQALESRPRRLPSRGRRARRRRHRRVDAPPDHRAGRTGLEPHPPAQGELSVGFPPAGRALATASRRSRHQGSRPGCMSAPVVGLESRVTAATTRPLDISPGPCSFRTQAAAAGQRTSWRLFPVQGSLDAARIFT